MGGGGGRVVTPITPSPSPLDPPLKFPLLIHQYQVHNLKLSYEGKKYHTTAKMQHLLT